MNFFHADEAGGKDWTENKKINFIAIGYHL